MQFKALYIQKKKYKNTVINSKKGVQLLKTEVTIKLRIKHKNVMEKHIKKVCFNRHLKIAIEADKRR